LQTGVYFLEPEFIVFICSTLLLIIVYIFAENLVNDELEYRIQCIDVKYNRLVKLQLYSELFLVSYCNDVYNNRRKIFSIYLYCIQRVGNVRSVNSSFISKVKDLILYRNGVSYVRNEYKKLLDDRNFVNSVVNYESVLSSYSNNKRLLDSLVKDKFVLNLVDVLDQVGDSSGLKGVGSSLNFLELMEVKDIRSRLLSLVAMDASAKLLTDYENSLNKGFVDTKVLVNLVKLLGFVESVLNEVESLENGVRSVVFNVKGLIVSALIKGGSLLGDGLFLSKLHSRLSGIDLLLVNKFKNFGESFAGKVSSVFSRDLKIFSDIVNYYVVNSGGLRFFRGVVNEFYMRIYIFSWLYAKPNFKKLRIHDYIKVCLSRFNHYYIWLYLLERVR